MRRRSFSAVALLIASLLALAVPACGGEGEQEPGAGAADTPEQAFEEIRQAMTEKEFGRFWELLASPSQEHFRDQLEEMKEVLAREGPEGLDAYPRILETGMTADDIRGFVSGRDLMIGTFERMAAGMTEEAWRSRAGNLGAVRVIDADVQGDTARLHLIMPDGGAGSLGAERRDGTWRIDFITLGR
jgi:hypothetical protein